MLNEVTDRYHQWPMSTPQFLEFINDKYDNPDGIHHYETTQVRNTAKTVIVPKGLKVPKNYSIEFYDADLESYTTMSNITTEITNYTYENKIEDNKRNIYVLKAEYLNVIINDIEDSMPYKEGSTQYLSETLVRGENIRLYS